MLAQLSAAFNVSMSASGLAQLAATLRALLAVNIPQVSVPPAMLSAALALSAAMSVGVGAASTAGLAAALAANLQMVLKALLQLKWSPPSYAPPASLAAVLGMDLQALAALKWSIPLSLPVVTFGLPALQLVAALNVAFPILATQACGICTRF